MYQVMSCNAMSYDDDHDDETERVEVEEKTNNSDTDDDVVDHQSSWPSILFRFDFADGFWQTGKQKSYIQIVILAPMEKLRRWVHHALLESPLF